jgi:hypothetical protein
MVPGIRAQQKEETRRRIAEAAAGLFGERGFDRTSVRDVAAAAGVDPDLSGVEIDDAAEFVLNSLIAKLDDSAAAALAQLRSMLTNDDAREHARTELSNLAGLLADALPGEDRDARAHLLLATNLGVAIARELLHVEPLAGRAPAEIAALLRPAVAGLIGTDEPPRKG